jgi:hypothetical protein
VDLVSWGGVAWVAGFGIGDRTKQPATVNKIAKPNKPGKAASHLPIKHRTLVNLKLIKSSSTRYLSIIARDLLIAQAFN